MTLQAMRAQLDLCCRQPHMKPKPPLTGLEKMQAEANEAREFWNELEGKDGSSRV